MPSLTDDELKQLRAAEHILSSEPMMWLMAGSNHVDSQLASIRGAYREWQQLSGGYAKYNGLAWKLGDEDA